MPTYVYKFVETGETIEVHQAFTDAALTEAVHPTTGQAMAVKKVFLPVGVTFRGGGFYKTDSRGSGSSSSTSSSGTSSDSSSSSSTSSSSTSSSSTSSSSTSSGSASSGSTPASSPSSTPSSSTS